MSAINLNGRGRVFPPTKAQREILDAIHARKGSFVTAKDVAAALNISIPAAHKRIQALKKWGMVRQGGLEVVE